MKLFGGMIACIAAIGALAVPCQVHAQSQNQMYIGTEIEGQYWCFSGAAGEPFTAAIYLQNPVNPAFGDEGERAVRFVSGFEGRLALDSSVALVDIRFPALGINVGTAGALAVGFAEPLPMSESRYGTVLAYIDLIFVGPQGGKSESPWFPPCAGEGFSMGLLPNLRPSIDGSLVYIDAEDTVDPLVAVDEAIYSYYFSTVVTNEIQTWGSAKALFR